MNAGKLNREVVIQQASSTQNSYGEVINTWATKATVMGSKEPLTGREYYNAQQIASVVDTRFTTRYLTGITPKMRIKCGAEYYNIVTVISPEDGRSELQLMCNRLTT